MKIALFHNVPASGAKRALYEHARHLKARGHTVDAFITATACEDYLPLAPICDRVAVYGDPPPPARERAGQAPLSGSRLRRVLRPGSVAHDLLRDWVRFQRGTREVKALERIYREMAGDINRGGYDLLYTHPCLPTLAPDLLRFVNLPTVFYCQDTLRRAYEWTLGEAPGYDAIKETLFRRKALGAVVTPVARAWARREERRYVQNLRAATLVLVNSWYSREGVLRTTGVDARVCYLGVDADFFHPDPGTPRENLVLSVGALVPGKRHDFVIEALAAIPPEQRPRLEIVGYEFDYGKKALGPTARQLVSQAETRGVALTLRKEVTDAILRDAYRRAGAVACAPYLEPFGLIPLEAQACGAPVVGVSEGGLRETIRDGETGFLTDRDPEAFGAALLRLLADPSLRETMGRRGRAEVEARWTWERSADTLERLLARVLADRRSRN